MKIEVRLFAAARELAGVSALEVELQSPATVRQLRHHLAEKAPALAPMVPHMAIAVGSDYVEDDALIRPGDQVACIPPVSGG